MLRILVTLLNYQQKRKTVMKTLKPIVALSLAVLCCIPPGCSTRVPKLNTPEECSKERQGIARQLASVFSLQFSFLLVIEQSYEDTRHYAFFWYYCCPD